VPGGPISGSGVRAALPSESLHLNVLDHVRVNVVADGFLERADIRGAERLIAFEYRVQIGRAAAARACWGEPREPTRRAGGARAR
jgi:hypothetical protein